MLWFWGLLGAFIYAGPKWVRCWIVCRETGGPRIDCTLDALICLGVGSAAGAAFTPTLLTMIDLKDQNAISALVGVFANPVVPVLTKRAPQLAEAILTALKAPKGDDK